MKRFLVGITAAMVLMFGSMAFAEDTKVTVGLKTWANSWETKIEDSFGNTATFDNGSAFMIGPSLNIRFSSDLFIGASYLVSSKDYESSDWFAVGDKMSFERKDMDVMLGFMVNPNIGWYFGYKNINAPMTYTDQFGVEYDSGTWTLKGPGIGLLANIPMGDTAALYGNFAIMAMKQKYEDPFGNSFTMDDMFGASLEVGVALAFSEQVSASVGLKAQSFSADDDAGNTTTETFTGVTAGVNYTF